MRQPVLAIVLPAEFGLVAFFDAVHVLPGIDFLVDGRRTELQVDICRCQFLDIGMLQSHLHLDDMGRFGIRIKCLAPPFGIVVRGVLAQLVGAVALMAGRGQIAEVDGVERVERFGQVLLIHHPLQVTPCGCDPSRR
ncbi:hypothetical protein SAMN05428952_103012 [Nitrosomonas sp. Nm132]|nr:hypothetical protein SAMN05428952_103012 [Nitrosomonas sp. Nm132]